MNVSLLAFLAQLKEEGIARKIPNISETNGRFLHLFLKIMRPKRILEIGCANGYSTIWLADAAKEIGAEVTTLDISAPSFAEAQENLKKAHLSDGVLFRFGRAEELLSQFALEKELFDFVFLDAEKAKYALFFQLLQPLLAPQAVIIVDDVLKFPEKTKSFWEEVQKNDAFEYVVLPTDPDDGIMLLRKR